MANWRALLRDLDPEETAEHAGYRLLHLHFENQEIIMAALDDLRAADQNLDTELGTLAGGVSTAVGEITALQGQIATLQQQIQSGVNPADLQPVIDDLTARAQSAHDAAAALQGALTPAAQPPATGNSGTPTADQPPADTAPGDQPPADTAPGGTDQTGATGGTGGVVGTPPATETGVPAGDTNTEPAADVPPAETPGT